MKYFFLIILSLKSMQILANDCSECSDPKSNSCLQVNEPWHFGESLSHLYDIFQALPEDRINAEKLRRIFKEDNDPCDRADTIIADNILSNHGKDCVIKLTHPSSYGKVHVDIAMPANLFASVVKSKNAVNFKAVGLPLILKIKNLDPKNNWSGAIDQIILTKEYAQIPRKKGCIQYNFR